MPIVEIAKKIQKAGGKLYLVGGAIRDKLLNKKISDEDYCVVGMEEEEFINLFPNAINARGKVFKVFIIEGHEFALARKEKKEGKGHKEFKIISNKNIRIEEDLQRRDITINAIAEEVLTGKIVDPFNGREDLKKRVIKAVSNAFKEDPLRVYRVARFAATFEFEVDKKTIKMMKELKKELIDLPKERVFDEFRKALNTDKPSIFFEILKKAETLDVHFKEIYDLIGARQPKKYHPEGDSYKHTLLTLDNSAKLTKNTITRFCALVHDLGKGTTPKDMYPHHSEHEKRGIEPLKNLSKRIGIPTKWKKSGRTAILEHMRGGRFEKMSSSKKVSFIERVEKTDLGLEGLQIVVYADKCRLIDDKIRNKEYNFAKIGKRMLEEVNGEFIKNKYKIEPGIEFGKKLHEERVNWMKQTY